MLLYSLNTRSPLMLLWDFHIRTETSKVPLLFLRSSFTLSLPSPTPYSQSWQPTQLHVHQKHSTTDPSVTPLPALSTSSYVALSPSLKPPSSTHTVSIRDNPSPRRPLLSPHMPHQLSPKLSPHSCIHHGPSSLYLFLVSDSPSIILSVEIQS